MNELYNYCKKCDSITVDYSQMFDEDKQPLCMAAEDIVNYYRNMLDCTNNWYAMVLDITTVIKRLGYGYHLELKHSVLVIEVCTISIVL